MAEQLLLNFKTKPEYNAVDFFVTPSNQQAYQWIQYWPQWPSPMLSIYGPQGCGKTHLAHVWQERVKADFYTLEVLQHKNLEDLFQLNPCLVIDDAQGTAHEKLLFHLYNVALSQKGYILLVSEQAPETWDIQLPDLASRLHAIPQCKIDMPDDSLRLALIQKLLTDHQMTLSDDIQQQMLVSAPRSFSGMRTYVENICKAAFSQGKKISASLIRQMKIT